MTVSETQLQKQIEREQVQYDGGVSRYYKRIKSEDVGETIPGRELVRRACEPVAAAIEHMVAEVEAGKAGRGRPALTVRYLSAVQPLPVAFITARACLFGATKEKSTTVIAMRIARQIEEHYRFDELRTENPGLSNAMARKAKRWTTAFHRAAIMRKAADIGSVQGLGFTDKEKLHVGLKLIELFIETTGLAITQTTGSGTSMIRRLVLTSETAAWLAKQHGNFDHLHPMFTPMVVPPKPWTSPISGGYLTAENRVDLVTNVTPEMRDDLFSVNMRSVYDAINRVQAVPFQINRTILDLVDQCWSEGTLLGGLPPADNPPEPERPDWIERDARYADLSDEDKRAIDRYKAETRQWHEQRIRVQSKRYALLTQMSIAEELRDEEAIYFPHNMDFRGRIYPLPAALNPQGDDVAKALLQFAEGKPLGESGAYWLCVHIANLFGHDKVSFDDRVAWVMENEASLMDSACNPLDGLRFWTEADEPWQALAAAIEFAGWRIQGDEYVSYLPIAMDGSCSGLQHFSAMLRDPMGARATNLIDHDAPADIYTEVLDKVRVALVKADDSVAHQWLRDGKLNRKIVKRPCMTYAYSVTSAGMRDQILDEMRKQGQGEDWLEGYTDYEGAMYLAPVVEQAIRDTVDRAASAMDWLKACAALIAGSELPVNWQTPDGFPAQQRYMVTTGKRFDVWFQGVRTKVQIRVEGKKTDQRKQQLAVAPNFVHSLDACHLRMVVNRMVEAGITTHFAMIHDSFAVHACDVDELHYAIRDEFINLYSEDRLDLLEQAWRDQYPELEIERRPDMGTFNIEEVRDADFFFA